MWLTLHEGCQIEIPRAEAWTMSEKNFARLYRAHVYGCSRRDAREWAKAQVSVRDTILGEVRGG